MMIFDPSFENPNISSPKIFDSSNKQVNRQAFINIANKRDVIRQKLEYSRCRVE